MLSQPSALWIRRSTGSGRQASPDHPIPNAPMRPENAGSAFGPAPAPVRSRGGIWRQMCAPRRPLAYRAFGLPFPPAPRGLAQLGKPQASSRNHVHYAEGRARSGMPRVDLSCNWMPEALG